MKTGLVIKELRIKRGLTQDELAYKTELSARTIQRIENGEVDPRAYTLQMIAKALDVDFSLFTEEESHIDQDKLKKDNRALGFVHLSGMLPLFFPTFLVRNSQKNKVEGLDEHFNAVISLQLTIWLIAILPGIGMYFFFRANNFVNKAPYMILIGILFCMVFSIRNAIDVINNRPYQPFNFFKSKNKKDSE